MKATHEEVEGNNLGSLDADMAGCGASPGLCIFNLTRQQAPPLAELVQSLFQLYSCPSVSM